MRFLRHYGHLLLALLILAVGVVNILFGLGVWGGSLPDGPLTQLDESLTEGYAAFGRSGQLGFGVALALTAAGLLLRLRSAWAFSILCLVALLAANLIRGDRSETLALGGPVVLILVALVLFRRSFTRQALEASILIAAISLASVLGFATLGTYLLGTGFSPVVTDLPTALYFAVITLATVGYGDIVPTTAVTRLFTVTVLVLGLGIFATALATLFSTTLGPKLKHILDPKPGTTGAQPRRTQPPPISAPPPRSIEPAPVSAAAAALVPVNAKPTHGSALPTSRRRALLVGAIALIALLAFLIINAPSVTGYFYAWRYGSVVKALPPAAGFHAGDRVLVVSPHPDDESLCCAGTIQHALAAGAEVHIVWLTSGDGFELDAVLTDHTLRPTGLDLKEYGATRMGEARAAAQALGVPAANLYFLGYPDGGLQRLFLDYYTQPYRSSNTGLTAVGYADALSPGAAYTGENLLRDLQTVFDQVAPTVVLAPSPEDRHPDHRTAGDLTLRLLGQAGAVETARWWIVHGGLEWPLPKGLRENLPLFPPPRGHGLEWQRVDLTQGQEAVKLAAVNAHRTQVEIEPRFMYAFVRRNELLSATPLPQSGGVAPLK